MAFVYQKEEDCMKKASKIFMIYLLSLLVFSLIFSWLGITNFIWNIAKLKIPVNPMMILTVAGGIISLRNTVSFYSFKLFLKIYIGLWILGFLVIYAGNQIGEVFILNRHFKFDQILKYHYENFSRISTPLPFIIFWFINYIFSKQEINTESFKQK